MRYFLMSVSAFALTACETLPDALPPSIDDIAVHKAVLTLDTHVDIPLSYMTDIDPGTETDLQVDLGKLESGALDAAFFIVYTPQGDLTEAGYKAGLDIAETRVAAIQAMTKRYYDRVELARTASDVRRIVSGGKQAVLIGMENAYPLGASIEAVPRWAERGVRYMGITHFGHNQFGDSSNPHPDRDDGPRHNGLSALGQSLVISMNEAGIMVDVSHAGKETMMQAADLSRTPIIASHSGVKAVADSARNLDDEQLRKIRAVGGVAQMVALDVYVKPYTQAQEDYQVRVRSEMGLETRAARGAMDDTTRAEYETRMAKIWDIEPRASVADFVDHIDHAVKIAGINHVGIASDFDGGGGIVGWEDASETANVTAELIRRGYSKGDIEKIWSGNLLRVLEIVERKSSK